MTSKVQFQRVMGVGVAGLALAGLLLANLPAQAQTAAAAPKIYVDNNKGDSVTVIDSATNTVLATIPVPKTPDSMAITHDGKWVFVASAGDTKISVIDTATDTITKTIEVGVGPYGLAVTPDDKVLLAGVDGTNMLDFIDLPSDQVAAQVPVEVVHGIGLSPDGTMAYVASQSKTAPGLLEFDVAAHKQIASLPLTAAPRSVVFSQDGKQVYVTETGVDSIQVLDPATNKIVSQIALGTSPHQPFFTDEYALIVSQKTNVLNVIDPATNTLKSTIPVGQNPHWVVTSADGNTAYVSNENDNTVSVVDLDTGKVTATIAVGLAPHKIVIQPSAPSVMATPEATSAS